MLLHYRQYSLYSFQECIRNTEYRSSGRSVWYVCQLASDSLPSLPPSQRQPPYALWCLVAKPEQRHWSMVTLLVGVCVCVRELGEWVEASNSLHYLSQYTITSKAFNYLSHLKKKKRVTVTLSSQWCHFDESLITLCHSLTVTLETVSFSEVPWWACQLYGKWITYDDPGRIPLTAGARKLTSNI